MINQRKIRFIARKKALAFNAEMKTLYVKRTITSDINLKTVREAMNLNYDTFRRRSEKGNWHLLDYFAVQEYKDQLENTPEQLYKNAENKLLIAVREFNMRVGIDVFNVADVINTVSKGKDFAQQTSGDNWKLINK